MGMERSGHLVGEENLAAARAAAQTRGDIHRVAYECRGLTPRRPKCAERDITEVHANADAGLDRQLAVPAIRNWREVLEYREPGGQRLTRTVFARRVHAKSGHHAIAGHVIDVPAVCFRGAHKYAVELHQQRYHLSRRQLFSQSGVPAQVNEQYGRAHGLRDQRRRLQNSDSHRCSPAQAPMLPQHRWRR